MEHVLIIGAEGILLLGVLALVLHHRYLTKGQVRHLLEEVARLEGIVKAQQTIVSDFQSRLIEKDRQVTTSREQAVGEYRGQVDSLRQQLDAVIAERSTAYERGRADGRKEGMADYAIIAQPFTEKVSGWFSSTYRAGYRFQFLVKGAPAFEAKTVVFQEIAEIDDKVKRTIMSAAQQALALIAQAQGIPVHFDKSLIEDPPI